MAKYYAGIGGRDGVPEAKIAEMEGYGRTLALQGYTLRSGAALGSDAAFERGCDSVDGKKQIFLPYPLYNNHPSTLVTAPREAYLLIDKLFPDVKHRAQHIRDFFARNCQQILGPDLDEPSDFVLCWTQGGKIKGGTGRSIRIAKHFDIHVVNLFDSKYDTDLFQF